jgi:uncharacterized protein YacL
LLKQNYQNPKTAKSKTKSLVDTCALIDGRILQLAKTGFIPGEILIPDFVIRELQGLADGRDSLKRQRARDGLDMIKDLQGSQNVRVTILNDKVESFSEVDDKLIFLAKQRNAALYTTDYNLNKVADIEGVAVLNVNELSQLLRPIILPGEIVNIKLVQKGNEKKQAVGYLEDGTMVVVDDADKKIGKVVKVEIGRSLQTVAGKMMFGRLISS